MDGPYSRARRPGNVENPSRHAVFVFENSCRAGRLTRSVERRPPAQRTDHDGVVSRDAAATGSRASRRWARRRIREETPTARFELCRAFPRFPGPRPLAGQGGAELAEGREGCSGGMQESGVASERQETGCGAAAGAEEWSRGPDSGADPPGRPRQIAPKKEPRPLFCSQVLLRWHHRRPMPRVAARCDGLEGGTPADLHLDTASTAAALRAKDGK